MKKFFSVIILAILTNSAFSQWHELEGYFAYNPGDAYFSGDICFDIAPDNGIYVATGYRYNSPHYQWYKITKSHDEGITWGECNTPPSQELNWCSGIFCVAPSEFVVTSYGDENGIWATSDDGISWSKLGSTGADGHFISGDFTDISNGLVLHSYYNKKSSLFTGMAELCRIENGIFAMTLIDTLDFRKGTVQMLNDTTGIILCRNYEGFLPPEPGNNIILKTTDSGNTWSTLYTDTTYNLNHILFISPEKGILAGNGGIIKQTSDGGITWNPMESGTDKNIRYIASKNDVFMCVGDSGLILRKDANSDEWDNISFGTSNYLNIKLNNSFFGFILTADSKILYSNEALGIKESGVTDDLTVYPNPCRKQVSCNAANLSRLKAIRIQNSTGQVVMTHENNFNGQLDISHLAPGFYCLSFDFGDRVAVRKLIKIDLTD